MPSIRTPVAATLLSDAIRHLNCAFCPPAPAGRLTVEVMQPPELPDHAVPACDRATEAGRDGRVITTSREGPARGDNVGKCSAVRANLKDHSVEGGFSVEVIFEGQLQAGARGNRDSGRDQFGVTNGAWIGREGIIRRAVRSRRRSYPRRFRASGGCRPSRRQGRSRHRVEILCENGGRV